MKIVKIPKKSGGERTIFVPDRAEKRMFRQMLDPIQDKAEKLNKACHNVSHGFLRGKSAVTNAMQHVGRAYTTVFDLKDFFDSVKESHLSGKLSQEEICKVLIGGAPRQGLPTSPSVANIAASDMDKAILKYLNKLDGEIVYTRYADDLTFSYDDCEITPLLKDNIPKIIRRCGFRENESKTRSMCWMNGRRIITGVAVDQTIHPTRTVKRRLRAALHQGNFPEVTGLVEWMRLKTPKEVSLNGNLQDEMNALCDLWNLKRINVDKLPKKSPDENLAEDMVITNDPVMMLGMSNWTNGWRSCAQHPKGSYRRSSVFWQWVQGTRIAAILGDKKTIAGVTRRLMRCRVLVHELENGQKVYDRFYGFDEAKLRSKLEAIGYVATGKVKKKVYVVGHGPTTKVWLDRLHSVIVNKKRRLFTNA